MIAKILKNAFLLIMSSMLINCSDSDKEDHSFKSNFETSESRIWVGSDFWANPLQDWQVINGSLECLVSKKNRNVHILTVKLDTVDGDFEMKVDLKVFNTTPPKKDIDWIGFSLGSKGIFNDYRDDAIFGKGLDLGVTTNGNLFIGELPNNNPVNQNIQDQLKKGISLKVNVKYTGAGYDLTVSILDEDKATITQLSKSNIDSNNFTGDLVLKSHYNSKTNEKSVSFKNWELSGDKVKIHPDYSFGPILFSQYTLSKGILKLTAQMAPVILNKENVHFQIKENNTWKTLQEEAINKDSRTATFRIENWDGSKDIAYRLSYKMDMGSRGKEAHFWEGTIAKDPIEKEEIIVAGFTGNDHLGFPNSDITKQVEIHNPDILFFSGDQIYEPSGGFGAQRFPTDKAMVDYLRKWYMYGWAFRDLLKDRPTVCITDDHDVYHGNIWGENGRAIPKELGQGSKAQDFGGYKMPAEWVNMVERTQTSHLPDAYDSTPVEQGIGTYYTDMVYGGISFAILEDRKFKSAPKAKLPEAKIRNGWIQNKNFDVRKNGDVDGAKLLGDRQLIFLNDWVSDWSYQSELKMLLSQTIFANVATLPEEALSDAIVPKLRILNKGEYPPNDKIVVDFDSNAWPQTGRDKAVKIIRKGFTFHLAGDQHLGSTVQYGVDEWNDAGFALCVPSISNHWPRRWYPKNEGMNRVDNKPKYTGDFEDGFGNKITVLAVSNPLFTNKKPSRLYDRATGFGIVRLNKNNREITLECWPRNADPTLGNDEQYEGWPITISQESNYSRKPAGYLPEISIEGISKPVIEVINEETSEIVYSLRINTKTYKAKIFDDSVSYTVRVGEPDTNTWKEISGINSKSHKIDFKF